VEAATYTLGDDGGGTRQTATARAFVAAALAAIRKVALGLLIGVVFLAGGAANVMMLPAPMWFNVVDLVGAYIPAAWIGVKLGTKKA